MTRIERFAARALQGLLAARTGLDAASDVVAGEVATAWSYADAMETEAKRRELVAFAHERPADLPVTVTADHAFATALTEGSAAAARAGHEFTSRDRRVIGEVLDAYGIAGAAGAPFSGRCELTHRFCEVRRFTFPARQSCAPEPCARASSE